MATPKDNEAQIDLAFLRAEFEKLNKKTEMGGACPSCGHCPHCGRGGYHTSPYWIPPRPYCNPYISWGVEVTSTGSGSLTYQGPPTEVR